MIVVGCGKSKLDRPAKAAELYTGSLFRAQKRYVLSTGEPWVILSAAHGVVLPGVVLRPYDQVLELRGEELRAWARKAACELERMLDEIGGDSGVELLAGERYAVPIASELAELGIASVEPLRGLQVGQRLRALKKMAEGRRA